MFNKKTVHNIDIGGKTVLVRADYNVPVKDGEITNDYRIKMSLPTIQYLIEMGCKIVICSHLGRPKGREDNDCSLYPVSVQLGKLLGKPVRFAPDCTGDETQAKIQELNNGDVLLLENLRYYPEEEANDDNFAAKLARGMEIFVQDGFGVVHRAHASTDAITRHLPGVAGLLLETEVSTILKVMEDPDRPLMALLGGAKISDKIEMLSRFIEIADVVAVGGAMSNTFLLAEGIKIGNSLAEPDEVNLAKDILNRARAKARQGNFVFYVPQDGVVAKAMEEKTTTRIVDWGTHVIADIESYPKPPPPSSSLVEPDERILDIGPFSGAFIAGSMQLADTVIWNGAMGVTEIEGLQSATGPFSHGTELVIEAMLGQFGHRPHTIVGGGDTVGYIENRGLTDHFDHVSTGGGASMDLMSGKPLPGVEALLSK